MVNNYTDWWAASHWEQAMAREAELFAQLEADEECYVPPADYPSLLTEAEINDDAEDTEGAGDDVEFWRYGS